MTGGLKRGRALVWALGTIAVVAVAAPASALALGTIAGTVTEADGVTPVGSYEVEVWSGGAPQTSVCTAVDGTWSADVAAGSYTVRFSGDASSCGVRSTLAPEWYANRYRIIHADPVDVTDGQTTANVDAQLQDGSEVRGTVTDPLLGVGVQNVTVDLLDVDGFTAATTCTGPLGTYALDPVTPGVFTARFSPSSAACGNAGAYAVQWFDHAPTQNAAAAVNIGPAPGEIVNNVNATMLAPVTLTVATAGSGAGTVTANRGGISCPGVCQASLSPATVVDLSAQPSAGSVFAGWSGACAGTQPCQLTMNTSQAVTATFVPASTQPPGGDPPGPGDPTDPANPPASAGAPNTRIDQVKVKAKSGRATFSFSGSGGTGPLTFECSVAKAQAPPAFKPCSSPSALKRLKKGKYRFEVRARGADGAVDESPASQTFRSKARRRK